MKILDVYGIMVRLSREMLKVVRVYLKFGVKFGNIIYEGDVVLRLYCFFKVENLFFFWEFIVFGFGRFKLSNYVDFWELMKIIEKVKFERIFMVYGFFREFFRILIGFGYEVYLIDKDFDIYGLFF